MNRAVEGSVTPVQLGHFVSCRPAQIPYAGAMPCIRRERSHVVVCSRRHVDPIDTSEEGIISHSEESAVPLG